MVNEFPMMINDVELDMPLLDLIMFPMALFVLSCGNRQNVFSVPRKDIHARLITL